MKILTFSLWFVMTSVVLYAQDVKAVKDPDTVRPQVQVIQLEQQLVSCQGQLAQFKVPLAQRQLQQDYDALVEKLRTETKASKDAVFDAEKLSFTEPTKEEKKK